MTETATTFDPSATIARMVPPSAHRVMDIDVTNRCDVLKCSNCTRGLIYQKERVDMTPENFRLALESVKDFATQPDAPNGHRVIAMIGGNPVLHPKFEELCAIFRSVIPNKAARGLWTNNIFDKGDVIRETFGFFNLNVHGDEEAAQKMRAELNWPNVFGSAPYRERSLHSSVFTAIQDFVGSTEIPDEAAMWAKIEQCDVNKNWSGSMVQIDGKLYGYFCEMAATFESIYGHKTGIDVEAYPGWWERCMGGPSFDRQAGEWCPKCGVSLKLKGHEDLAFTDDFSKTHAGLVQIAVKRKQKHVMHETLPGERAETATDYQRLTTPEQAMPDTETEMPFLDHPVLQPLIALLPDGAIVAELGSFAGDSALQFLASPKVATLYCIDAWKGGYDPIDIASGADMVEAEAEFDRRLAEVSKGRAVKAKGTTERWAKFFGESDAGKNVRFDLVYIDADHRYESIKRDILQWLPLVKPGGIIAGHDYGSPEHPGVAQAVDEIKLTIATLLSVETDSSWWMRVPYVAPAPAVDRIDLKGDCYPLNAMGVDLIVADGELQKFSHKVTAAVLADWVKALRPGGVLRISVPDFAKLAIAYAQGTRVAEMEEWLMGSHATADHAHGAVFDLMGLRVQMLAAGLRQIRPWACEKKSWLALEGTKPDHRKPDGVVGLRSVPRVGWTDGFSDCLRASFDLGMRIIEGRGVYFTKVLALVGQDLLTQAKYLLFIDYDSLFEPAAIMELYRLMESHPEVDAICGCQQRRKIGGPLIAVRGDDGKLTTRLPAEAMHADLTKVASAHFGLTLIRSSSLATFPKPWFQEDAGPDGDWKKDWCDADVNFWRQWEANGKTLFQANYVPVGHLQLMATWPSWDGTTFFQHVEDWQELGIPPEARR